MGSTWRGLAPIKGLNPLAIPIHDERPTADATRLRLDQSQHSLHGYRRIDRRATFSEHFLTRGRRKGVGSGCHVAFRMHGSHT
ncbi:hypothetical protein D3C84_991820 [compost metagenome]